MCFNGARPSVMDCSTARRVAPTRSFVFAVFNNARHRRIAAGKGKHLRAARAISLRVVVVKGIPMEL